MRAAGAAFGDDTSRGSGLILTQMAAKFPNLAVFAVHANRISKFWLEQIGHYRLAENLWQQRKFWCRSFSFQSGGDNQTDRAKQHAPHGTFAAINKEADEAKKRLPEDDGYP